MSGFKLCVKLSAGVCCAAIMIFGSYYSANSGATGNALFLLDTHVESSGLDEAESGALSPDGKFLYVADPVEKSVSVFEVQANSGLLRFVEIEVNNVNGVTGLDGARVIAVSPDGKNVYVGSHPGKTLAVFNRDGYLGLLTFLEVHQDGLNGVDGLDKPSSIAFSPDGLFLYVTAELDNSISTFQRNPSTGILTFVECIKSAADGLHVARSVAISPNGNQVYVASVNDNAVVVFNRDHFSGRLTFLELKKDNVDGVEGLYGAAALTISPDGENVYVLGAYDNSVVAFTRDPIDGRITFEQVIYAATWGSGIMRKPLSIAIAPDGRHCYIASETSSDLVVLFRDELESGQLSYVDQYYADGVSVEGLSLARWTTVSFNGSFVYAIGDAGLGAVSVFRRSSQDGRLVFSDIEQEAHGLRQLNNVEYLGGHVYVENWSDDSLIVFRQIVNSGNVTYVEHYIDGLNGVQGLNGPSSLAATPGGGDIYVTGYDGDSLAFFDQDSLTGALSFIEMKVDGVDSVDGLDGASDVAVSSDGLNVLVAGFNDDAVAVFNRIVATGRLEFLAVYKNGINGIDGLDGALQVAISPDGAHVFVAGWESHALAIFARNSSNGALTYEGKFVDGLGGVEGLRYPSAIAISPDGMHVYVASVGDDAVSIFRYKPSVDLFYFEGYVQNGMDGVSYMIEPRGLAISSDGNTLFVAAYGSRSLTAFRRNSATGHLSFMDAITAGMPSAEGVAFNPDRDTIYVTSPSFYQSVLSVYSLGFECYLPYMVR